MAKFEFKLNYAGVGSLLKSEAMKAHLAEKASAIQARCGDGYVMSTYTGKTRVNASIKAESFKARRDNMKNNTILKALR